MNEQEELLAQQKANCIFCKIVSGEIPSKRVYDDEEILAILDIRPAAKGHTLLMTKEHYPIMPLIPPKTFNHLFGKTALLSDAVRRGMLAERCTLFIANGAVAGQQSPHFLFHLIPREHDDGLSNFAIPKNGVQQEEIRGMLQQNLKAVMYQYFQETGATPRMMKTEGKKEPEKKQSEERGPVDAMLERSGKIPDDALKKSVEVKDPRVDTERKSGVVSGSRPLSEPREIPRVPNGPPASPQPVLSDQLAAIIESDPNLKALIIHEPAKLQQLIQQNPNLSRLFANVNLDLLSQQLRKIAMKHSEEEGGRSSKRFGDLKPAREMTLQELFTFIDQKPKLARLILENPEELKAMIPENERLNYFFEGSDIDAIISAYQARQRERS